MRARICETWKGTRKRVGAPGGACWLDADGRIGMFNQAQQREEGGFFRTGVGERQRRQEGAGLCTPAAQFPCYLSHCFFPPGSRSSWGGHSTQGLELSQVTKTWPQVRGLLPLTNSCTTHSLLNKQLEAFSHCVPCIPACTVRLHRRLALLLVSQAIQARSWHC